MTSCALLIAVGILPDGRRSIPGVTVSLSEAEVRWRDFLASLQAGGLHGVRMITSDDHAGLKKALAARFPGVPWQRGQFHLAKNLLDHVPSNFSAEEVSTDLRSVFNAPDRAEAERLVGRMVEKHVDLAAEQHGAPRACPQTIVAGSANSNPQDVRRAVAVPNLGSCKLRCPPVPIGVNYMASWDPDRARK